MNADIAYLHHGAGNEPVALGVAPGTVQIVALYALETLDLQRYHSLLIPLNVDQRYLMTQQQRLEAFLHDAGTVVINGHIAYPFLRWLRPFQALPYRGLDSLRVHRAQPHPIFDGIDPEDLTFRRGVAGFYARGSNPPAPGAVVLHTLGPDAVPIDWLLTLPGGGRLLVHSGNDLWTFHDTSMNDNSGSGGNNSTSRIVPQLFDWLARPRS